MQSFFVNKRGADSAEHDIIADEIKYALPLKAKYMKGLNELVLYTKPLTKKKLFSMVNAKDTPPIFTAEQHWCRAFPQAFFILIRQCPGISPKPLSVDVKAGEYDHLLRIEALPRDQDSFAKWHVKIGENGITISGEKLAEPTDSSDTEDS